MRRNIKNKPFWVIEHWHYWVEKDNSIFKPIEPFFQLDQIEDIESWIKEELKRNDWEREAQVFKVKDSWIVTLSYDPGGQFKIKRYTARITERQK